MISVSPEFVTACQLAVRQPRAKLEICWNGTDWVDESGNLLAYDITHSISYKTAELTPPGDISRGTVTLDNVDGRYSPFRTDSPLTSYISGPEGASEIEIRVSQGFVLADTSIEYVRIFTGAIFTESHDSTSNKTFYEVRDRGWLYSQKKMSTGVSQNINVTSWMSLIAQSAGMDAGDLRLDLSPWVVPYAWLHEESFPEDAWDMAAAVGARCYFDALGMFRYEESFHWAMGDHRTSVWDISESDYDTSSPETYLDRLASAIRQPWYPRGVVPVKEVYKSPTQKIIAANKTVDIKVILDDPVLSFIEPQHETDWIAITAGGVDVSDDVVVSLPTAKKFAQTVTIRITNSTDQAIIVNYLRLRGMTLTGMPSEEYVHDVSSPPVTDRVRQGARSLYIQSEDMAKAIAELLEPESQNMTVVHKIDGLEVVPHLELGDRVTFRDDFMFAAAGQLNVIREGFVVSNNIMFDYEAGVCSQKLSLVDAEVFYDYTDWFTIGVTALGSYGRAWR